MREESGIEALWKVNWAKHLKFYGAVLFTLGMLAIVTGVVATPTGKTFFVLTGIPGVILLMPLFFIRCTVCGASLYFRKGYLILTFGLKWVPVWMLPLPKQCEVCGLNRELDGKI
jgi:hypothetical protein